MGHGLLSALNNPLYYLVTEMSIMQEGPTILLHRAREIERKKITPAEK